MEKAPYFSEIACENVTTQSYWLTTRDGIRIRVCYWPCNDAKGTILFFTGRNEAAEKYSFAAYEMAQRGFAAIAIDWRGQGLSDRLLEDPVLGHVEKFSDYQIDVEALLTFVEQVACPRPLFINGHSMGGCIALRTLHSAPDVAAVSFTGPMFGIAMAAPTRLFAWSATTAAKWFGFQCHLAALQSRTPYILTTILSENDLTSDPEMFALLRRQAATHPEIFIAGPTYQWVGEALRESRALSKLDSPNVPCICFLGTEESTNDVTRIKDRMNSWPNSLLVQIPGGRHEVLIETPERQRVIFDEMTAHFSAHVK